mmetsp:Transcript_7953/g.8768  ORF Transcript_7953/g.8768 Transcript_7953/m.8768 type:complete len:93 (+) Transcript_7953:39-317(+)
MGRLNKVNIKTASKKLKIRKKRDNPLLFVLLTLKSHEPYLAQYKILKPSTILPYHYYFEWPTNTLYPQQRVQYNVFFLLIYLVRYYVVVSCL